MDKITRIYKDFFALNNPPFLILIGLLVLIPTFFAPLPFVSFQFSKSLIFSILVVLATVFFLIGLIRRGSIEIPKSSILISGMALLIVYVLSSIFSNSLTGSFFGYGFEVRVASIFILLYVTTVLVALAFNSTKKIIAGLTAFMLVATLLSLFHVLRLWFGPGFLSLGIFVDLANNTIGRWNDLSLFFGLSAIISIVTIEMLDLRRIHKLILWLCLALSLFVLVVINFTVVWWVLAFVLMAFFVNQAVIVSSGRLAVVEAVEGQETRLEPAKRKIAIRALIVGIVSVFFVLPIGVDLAGSLVDRFGVNNVEVRPSWVATYEVFRESVKTPPILGSGPNRFDTQWQLYRPDINQSNFWNAEFDSGIGLVPTSFVELGLLGVLAWTAFLLTIVYSGLRAIHSKHSNQLIRYLTTCSFMAILFLWIMSVLYVPGLSLVVLTFFFTGLFIASTRIAGTIKTIKLDFSRNPTMNFVATVSWVLVILLVTGLGYVLFEKGRSSVYFQKAINAQDLDSAETQLRSAIRLAENDIYYRTLSEISLARINMLIAGASNQAQASEAEIAEFYRLLPVTVEAALAAQKTDPADYQNHLLVARIYESLVPLGIEGSYESAKSAYEEALKLSPRNPAIYLGIARLEAVNNNLSGAEENVIKSLELKSNYIDAIFFQSQVDILKGDINAAVRTAEQAVLVAPNDPLPYFRLGVLKYEARNFAGAAQALENALAFVPVYANARYFLGLSYSRLGRNAEAIAQFEDLKLTNPDNAEVNMILNNLVAGRDPFYSGQNSAISSDFGELPIVEEN